MSRPAATAAATAASAWRLIPRPLLETILTNHAQHHLVPQPLLLHGPRGVGKSSLDLYPRSPPWCSSLLFRRLLPSWSLPPHFTSYLDLSPRSPPWCSSPTSTPPPLPLLHSRLSSSLHSLVLRGVCLGAISSHDVLTALNKHHGLRTALRRISKSSNERDSVSVLWHKAMLAAGARIGAGEEGYTREEAEYMREAMAALRVAEEVIGMHQEWRKEAVREMIRKGGFSRTLADSATDWPCLLMELLAGAAETDFFQPKLVLNNIDMLRKAVSTDDTMIPGAMYHDSFLWRLTTLGVNQKCFPVFFVTSDSYYSYQVFIDFGFKDMFISRETFGWTLQEAKLHMVSDFFTESEWKVIEEVLGPSPRHLLELYTLKQSTHYQEVIQDGTSSFEDIVDAYLAYLQVTVVDPAMELALGALQKFAFDACDGKIPDDQLQFGAPWRRPPRTKDHHVSLKWAKIQLMDFVQSFINTEFGVNYLADYSFEILDDPSAVAMLEVGLLYAQRDPSVIRPVSRGIQRCLVRWAVQQKMQMSLEESLLYFWQRIVRGRSYRHLMKEVGYK